MSFTSRNDDEIIGERNGKFHKVVIKREATIVISAEQSPKLPTEGRCLENAWEPSGTFVRRVFANPIAKAFLRIPGRREDHDRKDEQDGIQFGHERSKITLELTGRAHNPETTQVDDERQANSRSG